MCQDCNPSDDHRKYVGHPPDSPCHSRERRDAMTKVTPPHLQLWGPAPTNSRLARHADAVDRLIGHPVAVAPTEDLVAATLRAYDPVHETIEVGAGDHEPRSAFEDTDAALAIDTEAAFGMAMSEVFGLDTGKPMSLPRFTEDFATVAMLWDAAAGLAGSKDVATLLKAHLAELVATLSPPTDLGGICCVRHNGRAWISMGGKGGRTLLVVDCPEA